MKLSGYYKANGDDVELLTDYGCLWDYDKVFISKVFAETEVPLEILSLANVEYGGTGFFYDEAPPLPDEIEHHMPDYSLYDDWVSEQRKNGIKPKNLQYFTDYSIGFTTRGCIRRCSFCVNRNYTKVSLHSPVREFLDTTKKYVCLLDDNILAYPGWKSVIEELNDVGKPFQYKQGMDMRLMTDEKAMTLLSSKYRDDYIFAFDNIADRDQIEKKLSLWRKYNKSKGHNTKMYVFCGFDRNDKYDEDFWQQDIADLFERVKILMKHRCKPYIMRYCKYKDSPYSGIYVNIAFWCNQPSLFHFYSYEEICDKDNERKGGNSATKRYNDLFVSKHPEIAKKYFSLKYSDEVEV